VLVARRGVCALFFALPPRPLGQRAGVLSVSEVSPPARASTLPACKEDLPLPLSPPLPARAGRRQCCTEPVQAPTGPPICGNAPARELPTIRYGCWLAGCARGLQGCPTVSRLPPLPAPRPPARPFAPPLVPDPSAAQPWGAGRWWGVARHINDALCPTSSQNRHEHVTDSDALSALRDPSSERTLEQTT
jgi:hypothetical protein